MIFKIPSNEQKNRPLGVQDPFFSASFSDSAILFSFENFKKQYKMKNL